MLIPISITSKGQAFLPKAVRDQTGLAAGNRALVSVVDGKAVIESVPAIEEIYGIVKTNKVLTSQKMKETIKKAVISKYRRKALQNE